MSKNMKTLLIAIFIIIVLLAINASIRSEPATGAVSAAPAIATVLAA